MYLFDKELPYYKTTFWTRQWNHCEGCKAVDVQGISLDKAPPPLPRSSRDQSVQQKIIKVPPFDIQEIPDAMRLEGMPVAAKLMQRWFAGVLNYAPTDDDLKAEVNQNGEPYPPCMYDTATIRMNWILKFKRAEKKYLDLLAKQIHSQIAHDKLKIILMRYRNIALPFNTWKICKKNMPALHRHFQFQYISVGSSLSQKIDEFIESQFHRAGVPDDLTGALGSFNLYAAPADVTIDPIEREAVVSSVYVYVKDSYDFTDKSGDALSQYLGHWSSKGVIIVPYNGIVGQLNIPSLYFPYPVARGDVRTKGNVYYPVHNRDFRQWAIKHQRGGDFIIFSDLARCRLRTPIRVKL
ncbi:hypothetical protein LMG28688_00508 [Paraburkholderia caffeinitolerans]|uniref:Uncharacterized protein n=1 Tax=Paraburkholderia caffeinitolerans TaxID=1723730 RepID=A0A6J5FE11_9BURK|nr:MULTISPECIES: DUF6402 family protein [Paraburkholderia]CAB3778073.1 hypothetical protein LMG28688_00508 [Paraburkholderia caffeinitolerans]